MKRKDNKRKHVLAFNGKVYVPLRRNGNGKWKGICKQCALYEPCITSGDNPFLSQICQSITSLDDCLVEVKSKRGKR